MNWAALGIGLIIALYWGRVLTLVLTTWRQTGRTANLVPPEPVGRMVRIVWIPAVVAWIALPLLSGLSSRLPPLMQPLFGNPIVQLTALLAAIAAMGATFVCWKRMGSSWRIGIDPGEKTRLIVAGPYAFVRHPIYALSSLLMLATMVTVPSPLMLAVGGVHLILLQWEARREEQHLLRAHGAEYADYLSHVGRFLPHSRSPYQPLR
ncbi:MAG: methyltransferase family protein [Candidatus Rokuibacteriota bacterium]